MLAGGEEGEKTRVVICVAIIRRTNTAWKDILAGHSCLHKYCLRVENGKVIIKDVGSELLLR